MARHRQTLGAIVLLSVVAAGCLGQRPGDPVDVGRNGDFTEQDVTLTDGRVIHCLFWVSGQYSQSNTSGMSCDWTTP